MTWYEHLFGIVAMLVIICSPVVGITFLDMYLDRYAPRVYYRADIMLPIKGCIGTIVDNILWVMNHIKGRFAKGEDDGD